MKKPLKVFATLGLATSLLVTMPGLQADASGHQGVVEVKANNLYVRSDDSFNARTIDVLHKGETYKVYGESNGLYNLGGNQWTTASSKYVSYTPVSQTAEGTLTVKTSSLNVRSQANFNSKIVAVVHKGDTYKILEEKNGLYRIAEGRWVSAGSQYVSVNGTAQTTTTKEPTPTPTSEKVSGKVQIKVSTLNVRSSASFNARVVGSVSKGQVVNVYEKKNGLYRIGENRWISAGSDYVTTNIGTVTNQPTVATSNNSDVQDIINFGKRYMGMPYVWASSHPSNGGFDCSGFIYWVFKNNGYNISRLNVAGYWNIVDRTNNPQVGDLVFFKNTYKPGPSHIGIYLGNGKFLNSGSNDGVSIDDMNTTYWKNHFLGYGSL